VLLGSWVSARLSMCYCDLMSLDVEMADE